MVDMSRNLLKAIMEEPPKHPFPIKGLIDTIEAGYLVGVDREQRPKKNFSPSSLSYSAGGGACPRYWHFKFAGKYQVSNSDAYAVANMKSGTLSHGRIQEAIKKSGIEVDTEVKVVHDDPPLFGFVDNVIMWNGEEIPVEIKTMREESWQYRVNSGKVPEYHRIQLLIYMKLLKKARGIILYESKNSHALHAIPIQMTVRDKEWMDSAFDWMRTVRKTFDEGKLPKKPYRSNSKVCKKCPFLAICDEAGAGVVKIPALEPLGE